MDLLIKRLHVSLVALALVSMAWADAKVTLHNDRLAVTVTPDKIGSMKGLRVELLEIGGVANYTGIKVGDLLLGWISDNVGQLDGRGRMELEAGGRYLPLDANNFGFVPAAIAQSNTEQQVRIFRPSIGKVANVIVSFTRHHHGPPPWPDDGFGIVAREFEHELRALDGGESKERWVRVIRVWPYGVGESIGLQKDDRIMSFDMWQPPATGVMSFPGSHNGIKEVLDRAREHPQEMIQININNGDTKRSIKLSAALLTAPKV